VAHLVVPLQPGYKLEVCEVVAGALLVRQYRCDLRVLQASRRAAKGAALGAGPCAALR
jgi:hypothetical protein